MNKIILLLLYMDFSCRLEQFRLKELKDIFQKFQTEFGLLGFFKIYKLNKYDLVCLLRNSKCFIEKYSNYVLFNYNGHKEKLIPLPKKTLYRGEKMPNLIVVKRNITITF
tara:strand:+ start:2370 stop:2699 length:330 start_codon:yes stop_codon:yes gene_type:complete